MEELNAIYERMRAIFAEEAGFVPNDGCDAMVRLYALASEVQSLLAQADWVLAEVGRQPWAIQDLMPVGIAASKIGSTSVTATFFIFLALFTALLIAELSILFRQIKIGPEQEKE